MTEPFKKWVSLFLSLSLIFTSGAFDGIGLAATDENEVDETEEAVEVVQVQEETVEVEEEVKEEEPEEAPVDDEEVTEDVEEKPEAPVAEEKTEETVEPDETEDETSETVKTAENEEEADFAVYEDNEVKVTVTGAIPQNAKLEVTAITMENEPEKYDEVVEALNNSDVTVGMFYAYDIKFVDAAGNEVEPSGKVSVKIEHKTPNTFDSDIVVKDDKKAESIGSDAISVLHLEENAKGEITKVVDLSETNELENVKTVNEVDLKEVEFSTESFSIFVEAPTDTSKTISIGETIVLQCTTNHVHTWRTSNSSTGSVSIEADGNKAIVHALTKGSVTVYCGENTTTGNRQSFALTIEDKLTTVATVDSASKGVTIKMINLTQTSGRNLVNVSNGNYTVDLKGVYDESGYIKGAVKQELLSNKVGNDGYPTATKNNYKSLSGLFVNAKEVNHLFIQDTYDKTGYLEYSSFENYAYLGNGSDFTVYNQIGTPDEGTNFYYKRGNFMPYNNIKAGSLSTQNVNSYDPDGQKLGDSSYPATRKGESLYKTDGKNYYFGMEIDANFYQTDGGLDKKNNPVVYNFNGDDDLWVYVDGVLLLDIGGVSDAHSGQINFATGDIWVKDWKSEQNDSGKYLRTTIKDQFRKAGVFPDGSTWDESKVDLYFKGNTFADYTSHSFKMFYFERGAGASNLEMSMNLATVPNGIIIGSKRWKDKDATKVHDNAKELANSLVLYADYTTAGVFEKVDSSKYYIEWGYDGKDFMFQAKPTSDSSLPVGSKDGRKYQYKVVEENAPTGYEPSNTSNTDIVNTYIAEFEGYKVWKDSETTHDNSKINLVLNRYYMNGNNKVTEPNVSYTTDKTNKTLPLLTWDGNKFMFSNLKSYATDDDTSEYTYYVTENTVSGYRAPVYDNGENGLTDAVYNGGNVINTITGTKDIDVKKTWDDANDKSSRPASITVNVFMPEGTEYYDANGNKVTAVKDTAYTSANIPATSSDTWTYKFTGLPKYDASGKEIKYTITEDVVPMYLTDTTGNMNDGFVIKNTLMEDEPNYIKVQKTFVGITEDMIPDNFKITVKGADGKEYVLTKDNPATGSTITLDKNGLTWTWTITGLGVGNYTVTEANADITDYILETEGDLGSNVTVSAAVLNIKKGEEVDSCASKDFNVDGDKFFGATLTQGIVVIITEKTLSASQRAAITSYLQTNGSNGTWKKPVHFHSIEKLGTSFELNGAKITYNEATGIMHINATKDWSHAGEFTGEITKTANNPEIEVKNKYKTALTTCDGTKVWKDDNNPNRPETITINIKATVNNVEITELSQSNVVVTPAKDGNWSVPNLKKYDVNGNEVTYTATEVEPVGYKNIGTGHNFVNVRSEKTTVKGTKVWKDDNSEKRPTTITINITATVGGVKNDTLSKSGVVVTPDAKGIWKVEGFEKYDEDGKLVTYTAEEVVPEGYKNTGTGHDFENVRIGETTVDGTKEWKDDDPSLRVSDIKIDIEAKVKDVKVDDYCLTNKEVTVQADGSWSYGPLPKYDEEGREITYTATEKEITGYKNVGTGHNFINVRTDKKSVNGTKTWKDADAEHRVSTITVDLVAKVDGNVDSTLSKSGLKVSVDENGNWTIPNLEAYDADGKTVTYTVTEVVPTDYENIGSGNNFINRKTGKTFVDGTKTWKDDGSETRVSKINVNIEAKVGEEVKTKLCKNNFEVNVDVNGKWIVNNLDKYDENGKEVTYTVTEVVPTDYENIGTTANNFINRKTGKTFVNGTKTWKDDDAEHRVSTIYVNITAKVGGNKVASLSKTNLEVSVDKDGKWEVTDLPAYDTDGKTVTYTVEEVVPANYENIGTTEKDFINRHVGKKTLEGTKTWLDEEGASKRVSTIVVNIEAKVGTVVDSKLSKTNVTVNVAEDGSWKITNLEKYDENGKTVTYTVTEVEPTDYENIGTGNAFINRHVGKTYVDGTKTWKDEGAEKRACKISVNIEAKVGTVVDTKLSKTNVTVDVAEDGSWKIDNLEKYDENGKTVTYTVTEVVPTDYENIGTGTTFINRKTGEKTVTGSKTWKDEAGAEHRVSKINVDIEAKVGTTVDTKLSQKNVSVDVAEDGSWKIEKLAKYDENGKEVTYTVTEVVPTDYENIGTGLDFINRKTGKTYVDGTKTWKDEGAEKRVSKINVNIIAKVGEKTDTTLSKNNVEVDVDAKGNWVINDLAAYDAEGKKVSYTVTEVVPTDYENIGTGTDFINRKTGKTTVSGSKDWNDADNQDNKRPTSIKINLIATVGTKTITIPNVEMSKTVTENDNWSWTWTDLPKYDENGLAISYSITEDVVNYYTTEINGYNVKNTHEIDTVNIPVTKTWVEREDKGTAKRPAKITVYVYADGDTTNPVRTQDVTPDNSGNWAYTFTGLPKYKAGKVGQEIKYTIGEKAVDGYMTEINGYGIKNTLKVPELKIEKKANKTSGLKVGDTVTYTITVSNTGNVPIHNIDVTDKMDGNRTINWTKPEDTTDRKLEPGEKFELTATYVVTQGDVDAQDTINNIATATGEDPDGGEVPPPSDDEHFDPDPMAPAIAVEKTADKTTDLKVDEVVKYTIVVTNTGNVTLKDVKLTDVMDEGNKQITWDADTTLSMAKMAPGATFTATGTYKITQADVDAQKVIKNVATATGTDPKGGTVTDDDDEKITPITKDPKLVIEKTTKQKSGLKVGDTVTYTITVKNDGNVTIHDIDVTDVMDGGRDIKWTKPEEAKGRTLDPGKSFVLEATYVVTQGDVDAQDTIRNVATATGKDPQDKDVPPTDDDETFDPDGKAPALSIVKKADKNPVNAGDLVTYTITVTNTGNVTVSNILVTDVMEGGRDIKWVDEKDATTPKTLAPGKDFALKATYTVTQADVNAQKGIKNTATATGKDPQGDPVGPVEDDETITPALKEPALDINKQADVKTGLKVGDKVTYTITVTNVGNVTIHDIKVTDVMENKGDVKWVDQAEAEKAHELDPGENFVLEAEYIVTQGDVDKQDPVKNTATATGKDPGGNEVPPPSDDETFEPEDDRPAIDVVKTASKETGLKAGETVTYTIKVTNTGNVTIKNIEVSDVMAEGTKEITWAEGTKLTGWTLAPGEDFELKATYKVTQADVDAQDTIHNVATATGEDPKGEPVTDSDDENITPEGKNPSLKIEKIADKVKNLKVDDVVTYTIKVTNNGNLTIHDIEVTDKMDGNRTINWTKPEDTKGRELAPGKSFELEATYKVTQGDVDAQDTINNVATATGKTPDGDDVPPPHDDEHFDPDPKDPALQITKTADKTSGLKVGDTVTYTIVVKNIGNVTVHAIEVTDKMDGSREITWSKDAQTTGRTLAPGEKFELTATYVVTQGDVDAQDTIRNVATATGKDPQDKDVPPTDDDETFDPEPTEPSLKIEKIADKVKDLKVNDVVTYTIKVTNNGNVTIHDIEVTDKMDGNRTINWTKPEDTKGRELAPGKSFELEATYKVTQGDVDAQDTVNNVATATGKDPQDKDVPPTDDDEHFDPEDKDPALQITKTADKTSGLKVGDTVTYTIVVKNIGNVTVHAIEVTDKMDGSREITWSKDAQTTGRTLAPGEKFELTATYVVTQGDVDAQDTIKNVATATGKDPQDKDVPPTDDDEHFDPDEKAPKLLVEKNADVFAGLKVNDVVTYTIKVSNIGNVTIHDIEVTDVMDGARDIKWTKPEDAKGRELAPGEFFELEATYVVTQGDVDAQDTINNVATATGKDPQNKDVPPAEDDEDITPIKKEPALAIKKEADKTVDLKVGDTVTYTITVSNAGNVKIHDINVTDVMDGDRKINWTDESLTTGRELEVGGSFVLTATYVVTQGDIDAQDPIKNVATATGKDPQDKPVDPVKDDETITPEEDDSEITVDKYADKTTGLKAGDVITYTFKVTNTGNTTLHDIKLEDVMEGGREVTFPEGTALSGYVLGPNESFELTATYVVTQKDIDGGKNIRNDVTVTGKDPHDEDVPPGEDHEIVKMPNIEITKVVDKKEATIGETLTYTVTVKNTGEGDGKDIPVEDVLDQYLTYTGMVGDNAIHPTMVEGKLPVNEAGCEVLHWTIDELASGAEVTLTFTTVLSMDTPDKYEVENFAVIADSEIPPTPPVITIIKTGTIIISKKFTGGYDNISKGTAAFQVTGTKNGEVVYKNVVGIVDDGTGTLSHLTLDDEITWSIKEIECSSDWKKDSKIFTGNFVLNEETEEYEINVSFENTYNNNITPEAGFNNNFIKNDGSYTYSGKLPGVAE